jgi:hypothetical protein
MTGQCSRSRDASGFEASVPISGSNIRGHYMGDASDVDMISESDNPAPFENVGISEEPVYVESLFHPTDRANVIFGKIFREEMAPLESVVDILLTRDDEQAARKPRLTDPGAKSHCLHYSAGGATNGPIRGVKKEIPG